MIARPALLIALLATLVAAASAQADPVADFYGARRLTLWSAHRRQRLRLPRPADRAPPGPPHPG